MINAELLDLDIASLQTIHTLQIIAAESKNCFIFESGSMWFPWSNQKFIFDNEQIVHTSFCPKTEI